MLETERQAQLLPLRTAQKGGETMKAIRIFSQTQESAQRTEEFKRKAAQFEREEQESRAAYIQRNGITPEEAYQINYYPYHAFNDFD